MKRAVPAIALSAAGLTWLLHAQGVIDTNPATRGSTPAAAPPAGGDTSTTASPPTSEPSQTTPTTKPAPSGNRTVDGPVVQTRFGPVEVELVLVGGRIADVKALEYPNEARRSQFISEQALPVLHDEVLQAQSANIDTVSGATYTSDAYGQSLQAALDKAGITQ
ncbi:MAG: FMN-binding protein [Acidimicrobiia bacterium]|nr:FMN-binding protein [Acidimicrobiia bacterium]MBV9039908.1 FMN-binding protein [Acidimicrobiia bacterium]